MSRQRHDQATRKRRARELAAQAEKERTDPGQLARSLVTRGLATVTILDNREHPTAAPRNRAIPAGTWTP